MTRIKICGLTRARDAALAAQLGAWALGVIFAPESKRRVTLEQAAAVLAAAPAGIDRIGVFVNAPPDQIVAAVNACSLTGVQLHGEESPADCERIKSECGVTLIKALRVAGGADVARVVQFDTDYVLLDTYNPDRRGGTGHSFDWGLALALPARLRSDRLILSGGLNPGNVNEAVAQVAPFAVDISSGVESAPGIKDEEKMTGLFTALKEV
ncbi:MAG: phosphoribosylanthranilate isomerase [Thermoleophilia bacterium]